jgi:hypothetical protein
LIQAASHSGAAALRFRARFRLALAFGSDNAALDSRSNSPRVAQRCAR